MNGTLIPLPVLVLMLVAALVGAFFSRRRG